MRLVVYGLPHHENKAKTKHVESTLVPRLDEGSNPSSSTMYFRTKSENSRQTSDYQVVPSFFVSNLIGLRTGIRPKKDLTRHSLGTNQALSFQIAF